MISKQQNTPLLQSQLLGRGSLLPTAGNISHSWEYSKYLSFTGISWHLIKTGLVLQRVSFVVLWHFIFMYRMLSKAPWCCWSWVEPTTGLRSYWVGWQRQVCDPAASSTLTRLLLALWLNTAESERPWSNSIHCTGILLVTEYA